MDRYSCGLFASDFIFQFPISLLPDTSVSVKGQAEIFQTTNALPHEPSCSCLRLSLLVYPACRMLVRRSLPTITYASLTPEYIFKLPFPVSRKPFTNRPVAAASNFALNYFRMFLERLRRIRDLILNVTLNWGKW